MPVSRRNQSNAMLYALVTFVGLFIAATAVAVIYYVKFEEQRTKAETFQDQKDELATNAEFQKRGALIGAKKSRETYLGKMVDYLDEMVALIIGGPPQPTSAEVKVDDANRKVRETLQLLAEQRLDNEKTAAKTPTSEFVELLAKEQFSTATENFDETIKKTLPAEKLQEVWKSTLGQMGPFKKQIGARTEKQLGHDIMFVTCEFAKGPLDVKIVFNNKAQVAGLGFVPTPPDVLESYQGTSEGLAGEDLHIGAIDPNTTGLVRIIEKLKTKLVNTTNTLAALNDQLEQLHNRFDDFQAETREKEQTLLAEKEKYVQQVYKIKQDYDKLEALMKQTTEQQVQTLMADKDKVEAQRDKTRDELLKTQAQLKMNQDRMKHVQQELWKVTPPPDSDVPAYKPDGKIMLVDNQIVHLNIGSDNRVYRGLTFSVYEKNMPIPKYGKGKAEIEVFDVGKNFAAARITRSEKKRPIVVDDIVANLVWDSDKTNVFVVAGEFDLDGDDNIDYDGGDKIKALIKKWGGSVADTVSTNTDFLVLGRPPRVPRLPTVEDIEVDPMATEKYEAASQKFVHYNKIQSQAQALWIPVFNTERFLYFIGYKALVNKAMAF